MISVFPKFLSTDNHSFQTKYDTIKRQEPNKQTKTVTNNSIVKLVFNCYELSSESCCEVYSEITPQIARFNINRAPNCFSWTDACMCTYFFFRDLSGLRSALLIMLCPGLQSLESGWCVCGVCVGWGGGVGGGERGNDSGLEDNRKCVTITKNKNCWGSIRY